MRPSVSSLAHRSSSECVMRLRAACTRRASQLSKSRPDQRAVGSVRLHACGQQLLLLQLQLPSTRHRMALEAVSSRLSDGQVRALLCLFIGVDGHLVEVNLLTLRKPFLVCTCSALLCSSCCSSLILISRARPPPPPPRGGGSGGSINSARRLAECLAASVTGRPMCDALGL